jgi:membrane associated rhomboid family serine protease
MPDDFDYAKPVDRNRLIDPSTPIFTAILIVLCVVFTAAYLLAPHNDKSNVLTRFSDFAVPGPEQVWDGRYLGLFTSFFVHLSLMHIAFNMLWLWRLGGTLERTVPLWKYVLFLVGGTVVGSCCELLITGQTGAGASGAGYALMGLLWAGRGFHDSWRRMATRENMQLFLVWGVLCIVLTATHTMAIANGAHFGGFLFGLAIGNLFFSPRRKPIWIPALVFLAAVCVVSLTWMPWSSSWNWYKGNQAYDRHHYAESITYYERSLRLGGDRGDLLSNIGYSWSNLAEEERTKGHAAAADAAEAKATAISEEVGATAKAAPSSDSAPPDSGPGQLYPLGRRPGSGAPPKNSKGP